MAEMNIDAVVNEFGKLYIDQGQTAKDIKKQLFEPEAGSLKSFFKKVPETNTVYRSAYASVDEVLQAFAIPFNDKSETIFTPWETKLGEFKIDKTLFPDKMRQSWLGFLANIPEPDRSKWPIIKWMIMDILIPKSHEDFVQKVGYYGWKITGYSGTPTVNGATFTRELASEDAVLPASGAMDGIRTQIAKMVDATRAQLVTVGAWDVDDKVFCEQIEAMYQAVDRPLRSKLDFAFMSEAMRNRYREGKRLKYNSQYREDADLDSIRNTNISVVAVPDMDGSEQVWSTPADNRKRPVKAAKTSRFDVQKNKRGVDLLNDWMELLTFDVPEYVVTSDHDIAISAGDITERY